MSRAHGEGKKDGVNNKLQSSGVGQHVEGKRVDLRALWEVAQHPTSTLHKNLMKKP